MNEDEQTQIRSKLILKKPLKSYEVGEQKKLSYDLPIDTNNFRFGKMSQPSENGVIACMNQNTKTADNYKPISNPEFAENNSNEQQ